MKMFLSVLFFSILAAVGNPAFASEVVVTVAFDMLESVSDNLVAGTMTAQVTNLGDNTISNVNLRLESVGDVALSREVLQFGSVSGGDVGVTHLTFHANPAFISDASPTTWRLDYDLAGGAHHQSIVTSE